MVSTSAVPRLTGWTSRVHKPPLSLKLAPTLKLAPSWVSPLWVPNLGAPNVGTLGVNVPIADFNEEDSSPSGDERMMFEVEEANAEECELGEGAEKRSTKAITCQGDYLRRARGPAYYRAPPSAYVPRRMEGHDGEEEDSHDHQPRIPSPPPRPSMAPKLRREGNDWVVMFPEMIKHGNHFDVHYNKVTIFKVYDHYLRKYTYVCGRH
eukprot:GHVU01069953.1.p1 GENE.GHVU01069953.1~~GHVU01069953.1.p1  ORF type:complete len:239 (-),score=23.87 GHVU01069953.1:504-1127(-)